MSSLDNVRIKMEFLMKWINGKTTCWQKIFITWFLIDKVKGLSVYIYTSTFRESKRACNFNA